MKVLWFSNSPALGVEYLSNGKVTGTGGWLFALNESICNRLELAIAFHYPYKMDPFYYKNTKYYPIYNGNIILSSIKSKYFHWVFDRDYEKDYIKIIDEFKPDIIHIHGTENSFGCIASKTKIPIVTSIQGNLTIIKYKFFDGLEKRYLKTPIIKKFSLVEFFLGDWTRKGGYKRFCKRQLIEARNINQLRYFIGRTDWDRDIISIQSPGCQYFHNEEMMRDVFFTKEWVQPHNDTLVIHTTTGDAYYKGFETLCYALKLLQEVGLNVRWNIAGISSNDTFLKIVRKQLGDKYPNTGLNFLGNVTAEKLVESMMESDLYVMPSHIENSPNALCEAMLLGMPCIATCAGGTSSLLTNNEDGVLIQNHDPWSMAGAILRLYKNPEKAALYGHKARERALQRHDPEKIISELIQIYRTIIIQSNENTSNISQ